MSYGTDIDGENWLTPSSIGCDEFYVSPRVGPLSLTMTAAWPGPEGEINEQADLTLFAGVSGQASRLSWDFGDGTVLTNGSFITMHRWALAGGYTVVLTAYNDDHSNGVSFSIPVHVTSLLAPNITDAGFSGTNWHLSFLGQAGVAYNLEETASLAPPIPWNSVARILGKDVVEHFSFPKKTNATVFYRVRVE